VGFLKFIIIIIFIASDRFLPNYLPYLEEKTLNISRPIASQVGLFSINLDFMSWSFSFWHWTSEGTTTWGGGVQAHFFHAILTH